MIERRDRTILRKMDTEWICTQKEIREIWKELQEKYLIKKVKKKIILWKIGRKKWHCKEWKKRKRNRS